VQFAHEELGSLWEQHAVDPQWQALFQAWNLAAEIPAEKFKKIVETDKSAPTESVTNPQGSTGVTKSKEPESVIFRRAAKFGCPAKQETVLKAPGVSQPAQQETVLKAPRVSQVKVGSDSEDLNPDADCNSEVGNPCSVPYKKRCFGMFQVVVTYLFSRNLTKQGVLAIFLSK